MKTKNENKNRKKANSKKNNCTNIHYKKKFALYCDLTYLMLMFTCQIETNWMKFQKIAKTQRSERHIKNPFLHEAAIKWIIMDSKPFGDFRKKEMIHFLSKAVPGYVCPHRKTLRQRLYQIYRNYKCVLNVNVNQYQHLT